MDLGRARAVKVLRNRAKRLLCSDMQNIEPQKKSGGFGPFKILVGVLVLGALLVMGFILTPVIGYYVAQQMAAVEYAEVASQEQGRADVEFRPATNFDLQLADRDQPRRLKASVAIGITPGDQATASQITERQAQFDNIIQLILLGKTSAQLVTTQGRLELREEIRASLNHMLGKEKVTAVRVKILEIQ